MGRPGVGGHSVSGGGHSMSSHGGRGGSGSHTRPGVGSGSGGHLGSGHSSGLGGGSSFGHTGGHTGAPGNNHYGHQSHPGHYGHNHYGHTPPPPHHHHHHHYGGYGYNRHHYGYGRGYGYGRRTSGGSCAGLLVSLIIVVAVIILINKFMGNAANSYSNTATNNNVVTTTTSTSTMPSVATVTTREKLELDSGYMSDCVDDRVGWFDDEAALENKLQAFWEATGVQPYILIKEYDSALKTEAQKEEWAIDYYKNNLTSNTFLYVYFDEDYTAAGYDDTVGYMYQASGDMVKSVMDAEAVQIFWEYLDYYWMLEYLSTDDVFAMTFNSTAGVIMGEQSLDPGAALAQAQAEAAQHEAEVARGEALAAQAKAEEARAEAEAARAEALNRGTKIVKTILIVLLAIVGAVLLVLGVIAVVAIVLYNKSQKNVEDDRMLNTPLSKEEVYGATQNSTQNSAFSHPLGEKSATGMSASSRGVSGNISVGNHESQDD